MVSIKKLILDILKPHRPNALEFSQAIAAVGTDYHVRLSVMEVDENTETVQLEITSANIDFDAIQNSITEMGGSLHSIDIVEVESSPDEAAEKQVNGE